MSDVESPDAVDDATVHRLQEALLRWWDAGHRDLPWRRTDDPYAVLVSEVMLQQTQVSRVAPKYLSFLERFPTPAALAEAPTADVIRSWAGLGYNRRGVNLQRAAREIVERWAGRVPTTADDLRRLPGIGAYTARAVASIAFGEPVAAVDTNVRRVLTRAIDGPEPSRTEREVQALADRLLVRGRPGDWNQALMELGALVCLPAPACGRCPLRGACAAASAFTGVGERRAAYRVTDARPAERFRDSNRFYRGRIVDILRACEDGAGLDRSELGRRLRLDFSDDDLPWLERLLDGLTRDGLVVERAGRVSLPGG